MGAHSITLGKLDDPRIMSPEEAAYIAGMVDADGSICISKANMPDQKRPQFRLVLSIANTNFDALAAMQRLMGVGSMQCGYRQNRSIKWKDKGSLTLNSEAALFVIEQIRPYQIIKARQAALALEFITLKRAWSRQNDNWREQERCYERMQALNARGSAAQKPYELHREEALQRLCEADGCKSIHYGNGLCRRHYRQVYEQKRSLDYRHECQQCGSALSPTSALGTKYCGAACRMKWHRRYGCYTEQAKQDAPKCSIVGCERPRHAKDKCRRHYMQEWHAAQAE